LRRHFYMVVSRHRAPSPSLGALLGFCRAWAQRQQPG